MVDASQYQLEPDYKNKFKASRAKEIIGNVLKARLTGAVYHADNTSSWAREISDDIKHHLKEEGWPRYKYCVQVFVGEQRGEGVRLACRGFWDPQTDSYAHDIFQNESLFCVACAFGVYLY
ncbi:flagellar inner arm dynein light chain [Dunaliella salina]|uniref:Flagellar inner arm dynein light chain n=1 Tax=Dunaliella salina TaxID=3046 RepID=A0ABQ7GAI2_DUNSA|nr:flagellar inner arm dynein light chain [Dunaliella salina]|eukprot:KAF5831613.1 flagellar inner arm dynein light chain [Dunaliella salina]